MAVDRELPPQIEKDSKYLLVNGWEFKVEKRGKYGYLRYWDHPEPYMQRKDGRWYTQGAAVSRQKRKDNLMRICEVDR